MTAQWDHKIFSLSASDFEQIALDIFRYQYEKNSLYKTYVDALNIKVAAVGSVEKIPFLPIRFFKSHEVKTGSFDPIAIFESSGTTGSVNSRHFVKDISIYEKSFQKGFELFYGNIKDYCVIGLLPSYLERKNSSLVHMVNSLVSKSGHPQSGFYLDELDKLAAVLKQLEEQQQKTLLVGVSFALLDFAEKYPLPLKHTIIMETGGMKGRREEMVKEELHAVLTKAFGVSSIHSEYGMTELFSQAYSKGEGIFKCPPWMRIVIRDEDDPLAIHMAYHDSKLFVKGVINVIDLANIHSCCFIATDDAGKLYHDGSFEVLGRIDNSDIRGCSLLVV
ncbi:MAG TPA: acyl transferase [Chitinophagaceae bacterium]